MPTSAAGISDEALMAPVAGGWAPAVVLRRQRMRRARGFTLVELMVALIIIGVVLSMTVISGSPSPLRALETDAERLSQLFSLAREEAQIRGAPIRFENTRDRYRFIIFKDRQWRPIEDDTHLRARQWESPTRVRVEKADGSDMLEFGRDMIEPPFRVILTRDAGSVEIHANGLGIFEVQRQPPSQ